MKAEVKFTVDIYEHERGWGVKIDETLEFDTPEEADAYVVKHNSKNNLPSAPDLYWTASRGENKIIPIKKKK